MRGAKRRDGGQTAYAGLYGAVDLGTHNCRLLIAGAGRQKGLRVVDALSCAVRLGEGLAGSGRLSDGAMSRAITALAHCQRRMDRQGVGRVRAVATEACRSAANRGEFLHRVWAETGLDLQPISPAEESGLTLAGCTPLLDPARPWTLLFDIGGGSTEVIWVEQTGTREGPHIHDLVSLPAGVLTLSETLAGVNGIGTAEHPDVMTAINDELAAFEDRNRIGQALRRGVVQVIGTSGTVTTLAAVQMGLRRYRRSLVDGIDVDFDRIIELCQRLAASDRKTRSALPCVGTERADLLGVGCAILAALHRRFPAERLTVADRGIREGILLRMLAEDRAVSLPAPVPASVS